MVSKFVREQKRYTQLDLSEIFECSSEETVKIVKALKAYGVLKTVKTSDQQKDMSDLLDEDIEIADVEARENDYLYVFTYVGIVIIAGRVLKCYPKYLLHNDSPVGEFKQVLKVLEKYNSKEQVLKMFNGTFDGQAFNLLALLLYFLQDYYENGLYDKSEEIIEANGRGEIVWNKTINDTFAFLYNNRPYYIELMTKKRVNNEYDYFRRLHECILTHVSEELKGADLLELFEISEVNLTEEVIEDFGDKDYILYRIENELNQQFNTRKQLVLKAMFNYISHDGNLFDLDCLSVFGTNSFNLVWEKVCSEIMDNQLYRALGTLRLPVQLNPQYDRKSKLIDLIEKPSWTATGMTAKETLIPDLVSIAETKVGHEFIIFDAKYYNAILEVDSAPKGQPGIESITKQYLYQLAYQRFIRDHHFATVRNCFLLPTEMDMIIDKGESSLMILENLGLESIKVRFLPAALAYAHYLSGKKMNIEDLNL